MALLAAGAGGYALGSGQDSPERAEGSTRLRACPASAWAHGGGYDYAVAGISCRDANSFIVRGRRYQAGAQEGRALRFGYWICFQRAVKDRAARPATLNVCANGESRLRFLMA